MNGESVSLRLSDLFSFIFLEMGLGELELSEGALQVR